MSVSSIFGSPILLLPKPSLKPVDVQVQSSPASIGYYGGGLMIECSSRPKKKATAHHMKTRPKKTQPWDIRRKPTVYPPLPALPLDWTLVSSADDNGGRVDGGGSAVETDSASAPALEASTAKG